MRKIAILAVFTGFGFVEFTNIMRRVMLLPFFGFLLLYLQVFELVFQHVFYFLVLGQSQFFFLVFYIIVIVVFMWFLVDSIGFLNMLKSAILTKFTGLESSKVLADSRFLGELRFFGFQDWIFHMLVFFFLVFGQYF